jgi:glycosyltransferase involved in cell wall biosynthesis
MKVLHLPSNIASQVSITVRALRDIGIDARGLVVNNLATQRDIGIETHLVRSASNGLLLRKWQKFIWWLKVIVAIQQTDIVHWHSGSSAFLKHYALSFAAKLNKARIVEFWGTDIRYHHDKMDDNPYFEKLLKDPNSDYHVSFEGSRKTQKKFSRYEFDCLTHIGLLDYVETDLFPNPFQTRARLILAEFEPKYPVVTKHKPLIVHAPSRKMVKGTPSVLAAIEKLKNQYDFDFKLAHGVSHAEAIAMIQECDVMLDQFVLGSYGVAALEAMALGKPVVCYIKPSLIERLPSDFPIVNANQDNLVRVLGGLLEDGHQRHQIGKLSRIYVEKHHDAHKIARNLVKIYEEITKKKRSKEYRGF